MSGLSFWMLVVVGGFIILLECNLVLVLEFDGENYCVFLWVCFV